MSLNPAQSASKMRALVDRTPASGPKRRIGLLAITACIGGFLFGYDTGVISGALPYMLMPSEAGGLQLTPVQEGLIGGILLLGCAVGAVVGGRLSDRYGRRHNILILAVVFFVGAVGCALAPNITLMYVARFVLGLAVGGASTTVPVYLSESAPKEQRGMLVAVDQLMIVTGQFAAFVMNAVIAAVQGGPAAEVANDPQRHLRGRRDGLLGHPRRDGRGHRRRWQWARLALDADAVLPARDRPVDRDPHDAGISPVAYRPR